MDIRQKHVDSCRVVQLYYKISMHKALSAHVPPFSHRRKVAAALSAAVTTAKQQEPAPTLQAEPSQKKRTR